MSPPFLMVFLGLSLPIWGLNRGDLEAQGFKLSMTDDPRALGMDKKSSSQQLGEVSIMGILFPDRLEGFILDTKCSPEQLTAALKTVTYCKEKKGEFHCGPKEPTNPFAAKVCGSAIMLWKEGNPETLRQVNMGCQLGQDLYRRAQEAKPDAGTHP